MFLKILHEIPAFIYDLVGHVRGVYLNPSGTLRHQLFLT